MPITKALEKRKKILIIGPSSSLGDKLQNELSAHVQNARKEIVVIPPIVEIQFKNLISDPECEQLKSFCAGLKACLAIIHHLEEEIFDIDNYIHFFDGHFDCVIDLVNADEHTLCHLYEGKNLLKLTQTIEYPKK